MISIFNYIAKSHDFYILLLMIIYDYLLLIIWRFPYKTGYPQQRWMVVENPIHKGMMTGGSPMT